jgi:hypothetical protein
MSFLNPLFLLALAAIAVPLAVHFWRIRKPERLPFSSLVFFRKLQQQAMKRLKLKEYLLLATRMLAVALLALALARPFLPPTWGGEHSQGRSIILVIDNSPSMERVDGQGPYVDQAKQAARQILDQANEDDRFVVWASQGIENDYAALQWLDPEQAKQRVDGIQTRSVASQLESQFRQLRSKLRNEQQPPQSLNWYIIGDQQEQEWSNWERITEQMAKDANAGGGTTTQHQLQYVRVGNAEVANLAVRDMAIKSSMMTTDQPFTVEVTVSNTGELPALNQFISLKHQGMMVGQYEADLEPGVQRTFDFEVTAIQAGEQRLEVVLDGDEVTYDNIYRASLQVADQRKALYIDDQRSTEVSGESYFLPMMEASQQEQAGIAWQRKSLSEVSGSELGSYNVLVLDGWREIPSYLTNAITNFVQEGGGVLVFPSPNLNIGSYNTAFERWRIGRIQGVGGSLGSDQAITNIQTIEAQHPLFDGIFETTDQDVRIASIPVTYFYRLQPQGQAPGQRTLIQTATREPILVDSPLGQGRFLVSTVGMNADWSELPFSPLFAPLWYQAGIYLASGESTDLQTTSIQPTFTWQGPITQDQEIALRVNDLPYRPTINTLPGARGIELQAEQKEWQPGWIVIEGADTTYTVGLNISHQESVFKEKSLNTLDNRASNSLHIRNEIDVASLSNQEFQSSIRNASFGQEIWQWFTLLAVILLIVEMILATWYNPTQAKQ